MGVTTGNRLSRKITLGFLALVSVSIVAIFAFSTTCHQNVTVCRSEETRCGSDEREVRAVSGLDKEDIISDEEQDAQVPFESVSADSSVRQESPSQPVVVATNSVNNHNFEGKKSIRFVELWFCKVAALCDDGRCYRMPRCGYTTLRGDHLADWKAT